MRSLAPLALGALWACSGGVPPTVSPADASAVSDTNLETASPDASAAHDATRPDAGSSDAGLEALSVCLPGTLMQHVVDALAGAYTYSCEPCPTGGPWTACAYPAPAPYPAYQRAGASASTTPMAIDFVTDEMGGTLVFTRDGTSHTVLFHSGEGAATPSKSTQISAYLEEHTQANTVHVQWAEGAPDVFGSGQPGGWWTRKTADPVDVPTQLDRPGAVLRWVHDHLVAPGEDLGTVGCSLGTMATLGSVLWAGSSSLVAYQWVAGGSAFWDVNASCGRAPAPYSGGGHCDSDAKPCTSHCDCSQGCPPSGGGYSPLQDGNHTWDWCRMPTDVTTPNFAGLINYLMQPAPGSECLVITDPSGSGGDAPPVHAFDASSFRTRPPTTYALAHPIDFVVQEDGDPRVSQIDQKVLEGATMFVFEAITKANGAAGYPLPTWTDYQPNNHCDHFEGPVELTDITAKRIIARMSL